MKISFLENGMDSLQKGYRLLLTYEKELVKRKLSDKERYFILKDAILSIHHGVEILFKSILFKHSEYLIFSEINKNVKNAYTEKKNQNLNSIFETSFKNKIHTVTFDESVNRVETICGNPLPERLKDKINELNTYRNLIIHSEIFLNENDINNTFDGFIDLLDIYFFNVLDTDYKTLSGYSKLKENYKKYKEDLKERKLQLKSIVMEKFLSAFEKLHISMGENEVKLINDINIAMKLIDELKKAKIFFGMDLYDYSCSGNTEIKRYDKEKLSFFTSDNNADFIFKFKSMMIFIPKMDDSSSPILFFESDKINVEKELEQYIEKNYHGKKQLSGLYFIDDKKEVYGNEEIYKFEEKLEYDETFVIPKYYRIEKYIDPIGVFGFVNVQGLDYGNLREILHNYYQKSLKELEIDFRDMLNQ